MRTKTNYLKSFILLVLGLIAGIGGAMFFGGRNANTSKQPLTKTFELPTDMKLKSVVLETHFQNKLDSLQQTNAALSGKIFNTQSALQKAKHDNKVLLELVDTLMVQTANEADTPQKLADCDTLQSAVKDLVLSASIKDSLYEDLSTTLSSRIANKDSVIGVLQQEYLCQKLSFDQSLVQQQLLSGQSNDYQQQLKRFKAKNKLLSAGLFILSGIATYGLLHHN